MMDVNNNEKAILEHALTSAILNSSDYAEIEQYQLLLTKFKTAQDEDGFRYDYDN
ncbi:hypothetical protein GJU40_00005 [Bacillus lacus]|uniref:Uncharacterized protein n=1 Tax=Metabacillus lacus TaxID=1983721 RepID=A0A7X2IVI1_9BACI|nr:hypothetical protein [Metabacillus lacus]MRX70548.1 hypothetical protein [Metabacillus lacus]